MLISKYGTVRLLNEFLKKVKEKKFKLNYNLQNTKGKTALIYGSKWVNNIYIYIYIYI